MASTCPLCDTTFPTDEERRIHMNSCSYPKKGQKPKPKKSDEKKR